MTKEKNKIADLETSVQKLKDYIGKNEVTSWMVYVEYADGNKTMGGLKIETEDAETLLLNLCDCLDQMLSKDSRNKMH